MCLADAIEAFLKSALESQGSVVMRRRELAERFRCAPSQINYVLMTRFAWGDGYVVETRRGGAGFIRVTRVKLPQRADLRELVAELGDAVTQEQAGALIRLIWQAGLVTAREAALMMAVVRRESIAVPLPDRDRVRGSLLRAMLLEVLDRGGEAVDVPGV